MVNAKCIRCRNSASIGELFLDLSSLCDHSQHDRPMHRCMDGYITKTLWHHHEETSGRACLAAWPPRILLHPYAASSRSNSDLDNALTALAKVLIGLGDPIKWEGVGQERSQIQPALTN